jgi:hypothetical protein
MTPTRRKRLRQLLWLYFWLLIFEGALRRWLLPGLSNPLLLVRDPVALLALWWGWPLLRQKRWRVWLLALLGIGLLAFVLAITAGHGDIFVAAFGARILLLHFPLIFLYAALFDRNDVIQFAWILAWISIPMTFLIMAQSNLPSNHFLNVAPGGEGTAVFSGALGRFRPPGVFSFINGVSTFYTLAASALFLIFYGVHLNKLGKMFCLVVAIFLMVALPVSISRSLLAGYIQVVAALVVALLLSRSRLIPVLSGFMVLFLAGSIAVTIPAFQETSGAFLQRWENAASSESPDDDRLGGAVGVFDSRVIPIFTRPFEQFHAIPILGYGVGMGTQVAANRLTGSSGFQLGESSWDSSVAELGILLGPAFLTWRSLFSFWILRLGLLNAKRGNILPLILLGSSFLPALIGQLGQPTGLGFLVVSAGLTLAACNRSILCLQRKPRSRMSAQLAAANNLVPSS